MIPFVLKRPIQIDIITCLIIVVIVVIILIIVIIISIIMLHSTYLMMVALIVLNVKRPIPINLLADVQDCRNHMGSKPEHLVNRVCNKHNYSNCKVVVFLERVAINYFQAYPFQLLEYHIISQAGAIIQDLEFETFLKKAPQRQNLGLWD